MRTLILVVMSCLLAVSPALAAPPTPAQFAGDWVGALEVGGKLRLVLHITNNNGVLGATMDSIDQGAKGIPVGAVTVDGAKLHLDLGAIKGTYDAILSDDGNTLTGTWAQSGLTLPLTFTRGDASSIPTLNRPQEPKPPFPYHAEDVTFPGPGGISLAGTLTHPDGTGPFPAVLLITGSGPQDRDETVFGHRPFLILADNLTRKGLAVLRVDDRGVGKSTGTFATSTTEDFTQDALAGVAFLKARKDVDAKRIGLVGHSEGGIIAPMVAARSKDVAFIVLMAGVGVPAEQLLVKQSSAIMKANGMSDADINANAAAVHRMCAIARSNADAKTQEAQLQAVADSLTAKLTAIDASKTETVKQEVARSMQMVGSPWFHYLVTLKPAETLGKVRVPVLAVNGTLDLQVDAKDNLPAIEKALKAGGNKDVTVQELPGLNHLFQTATTGSPAEYSTIEETMSPVALKVISDWIVARAMPKK